MPSFLANGVPLYPAILVSLAAVSTVDDRPPPEPAKLLEEWMEWERGDELPGRVMSNLKKGRLPDILVAHDDGPYLDIWREWEKGKTVPQDVLTRLREAGLGDRLRSLAG
jgi:hypothetical protein